MFSVPYLSETVLDQHLVFRNENQDNLFALLHAFQVAEYSLHFAHGMHHV
jgi:hypothetical protein